MKVYIKNRIKEDTNKSMLRIYQSEFIDLCREYMIPLSAVAHIAKLSRTRIVLIGEGRSLITQDAVERLLKKEPFKSSEKLKDLLEKMLTQLANLGE